MIEVKVVADSIGPSNVRLTTFVLTYPRFLHSEFMTHRMFSRNASSSRAIPVSKQIQMVIDNPAIPLAFTRNQKGMQGGAPLDAEASDKAVKAWLDGRDRAIEIARQLESLEVHKQYANRVLEPYAHITVVCTATDYNNFYALRDHPAALPEICVLAQKMYSAQQNSIPKHICLGEWHLPFITEEDYADYPINDGGAALVKMSVARCARVSYLNHDGKRPTFEQDMQLYDRLLGQVPIHASPAEHQATPFDMYSKDRMSGNLRGWMQYRKSLANENITEYNGRDEGQLLPDACEKGK